MENRIINRATGWIPGFILRDAAWPDPTSPGTARFACLSAGEFGPLESDATWSLRLGSVEQLAQAECRICCRGVRMRLPGAPESMDLCLGPDGTLVGRLPAGMTPTLFSVEGEIQGDEDGLQVLPAGGEVVLLQTNAAAEGVSFALLNCRAEARNLGITALREALRETSPVAVLTAEFAARDTVLPHLERDDAAATLALEVLIDTLRPATLRIPCRWSASPGQAAERFDLNETLPQIFAWLKIDPAVATDLIRASIAVQRPDGLLPARVDPTGALPPSSSAAWPMLGRACLECFDLTRDFSLTEEITPQLREYCKALPSRYRQEENAIPTWPSAEEALVPELWDEGLASTDLSTLLIAELGALAELFNRVPGPGIDLSHLLAERARLSTSLSEHFWNAPERIFTDRYVTSPGGAPGAFIRRVSLGSYLPLALPDLGPGYREALIHHLDGASSLLNADGLQHWQSWDEDEDLPGVDALVQSVAFLLVRNHPAAMTRLRNSLEETQRHFHGAGAAFPRDLRLVRDEEGKPVRIQASPRLESSAAALFLLLTSTEQSLASALETAPAPIKFLERHRHGVTAAAILIFLGLLLGIPQFVIQQSSHRGTTTYLKTTEAATQRKLGNHARSIELYQELLDETEDAAQKRVFASDIARSYFSMERFDKSSEWFARVAAEDPASASAHLNLGLSLYRERKYSESIASLTRARDLAADKQPELAQKAGDALRLVTPLQLKETRP